MPADAQNAIPSTSSAFSQRSTLNFQPPQIPDHELLCLIGRGAYGEVWLARNTIGTLRAVKIVHRQSFGRVEHFEREFKGLLKFEPLSRSHDGLVDILQLGRRDDAGYFFYVMELADESSAECGTRNAELTSDASASTPHSALCTPHSYAPRTLRSELQAQSHLLPAECIALGLKLAAALEHLHANGLVHRDIKPSNIIFVKGEPKLADIGLVTAIDEAHSLVGTVGYIPPEGPGTPQADLYSLGKVLYEIALGKDRQDFPQLPPDLQSHPDYAALLELNEVILKACESDPRLRYASAVALNKDLALLQRGQSVKQKRTSEQRWAAGKKAGLVVIVVAMIVAIARGLRPNPPRSEYASEGPPSTNELATALCDKAMSIIRADNYAAMGEAYTNFHKAIALDPNYARPYIGLFDLRTHLPVPSRPSATTAELRAIVGKLEELGPNLAATYMAQSWISFFDLDFPRAEQQILQALAIDPKVDPSWYGFMLTHWGRPEEARRQLELARVIWPSQAIVYRIMGHTYYAQRDYTNAIAWYQQAVSFEPRELAANFISQAYRALGDYPRAIDCLAKAEILRGADEAATQRRYDELRQAFAAGGPRGYWEEQWKRAEKNPDQDFCWKAEIQAHLGNTSVVFLWLNRAYETPERVGGQNDLVSLLFNECWDGLRDDPRFKELLDKIGFTKVMPKKTK